MKQDALQQAARFAFSPADWLILTQDSLVVAAFAQLDSVDGVEAFVFEGYDRLRNAREQSMVGASSEHGG